MEDCNVAVVTGGAQGLGASITKALLNKAYRVVVADINEEKGKEFVRQLTSTFGTSKILFHLCDVTKQDDYKAVFDFTLKEFKRIDVLVNNAGILNEHHPQRMLNINVLGVLNGIQTAFHYMGKSNGGKGGFVVNTASIAGFITHPAFPVYCASKHAVIGLTRSYANPFYFNKEGVMFFALCPSYVKTDMVDQIGANTTIKGYKNKEDRVLLNSDDVAQGVIKLLDDKINGSTLVCTTEEGFFYVGLPRELENISLE
ncbi:15-hydroxyprostaglandin dehydrogenase [NAD(+)] [Parasteatoda tepidariorum]|uniref:15-hydroxyprostaglandin dehydrogenase [NAD(+)] n=1 Tax=Parasteatoda tepidariorum TaxID=114398 RepID=UPI00077F9BD6|nr:15-hydroxyprostaglandin dehydrogenase [NAD(+)] isoform X2 [Parasteatoda tepidariorum]XP_042904979.1 15-hydroxyprostaglandin dehydrogenase [NAD(+)] isoform X1 [Parasteatoda tepidariorum]